MDIETAFNEMIAMIETMDPEIVAGGIIFYAVVLAVIVASAVIRYLMISIGYSKMYRKAGVAGWKAFIPVYHTYNNFKICWETKFFFLYAVLYVLMHALGNSEEVVTSLIAAAAGIALLVVGFKQSIKMAKCFGKGAGTGILLVFFPGITSLVLGFGKSQYLPKAE